MVHDYRLIHLLLVTVNEGKLMAYSIVLQLLLVHVDDAVAHAVQEILRVRNHHQDTRVAENRQPYITTIQLCK